VQERKKREEEMQAKLSKEKAEQQKREAEEKRKQQAQAEQIRREERIATSQRNLTIRRVKKTTNLGNIFEKQIQEQQAQAVRQKEQQRQAFVGTRLQLAKNLEGIFHPSMMAGGRPPPRARPPSLPAETPHTPSQKVTFQVTQDQQKSPAVSSPALEDKSAGEFVDNFLEIRKARVVGARGRRAPTRKPRGITVT